MSVWRGGEGGREVRDDVLLFAEAKAEFDAIVSNGWVGAVSCSIMAEVWAELGNAEEVQNVMKTAEAKGLPTSGNTFNLELFLLKAQLKR